MFSAHYDKKESRVLDDLRPRKCFRSIAILRSFSFKEYRIDLISVYKSGCDIHPTNRG